LESKKFSGSIGPINAARKGREGKGGEGKGREGGREGEARQGEGGKIL